VSRLSGAFLAARKVNKSGSKCAELLFINSKIKNSGKYVKN
jgi:hypothetical protein